MSLTLVVLIVVTYAVLGGAAVLLSDVEFALHGPPPLFAAAFFPAVLAPVLYWLRLGHLTTPRVHDTSSWVIRVSVVAAVYSGLVGIAVAFWNRLDPAPQVGVLVAMPLAWLGAHVLLRAWLENFFARTDLA